jgi:hypothetical protein
MTWKQNSLPPVQSPRKSPSDPYLDLWRWLSARYFPTFILLLPLIFVGCSKPVEVSASLPPAPAFGVASVPAPRVGEPLVLVCAREQAGRLENEAVIHSWERWYERLMS